MAAEIRLEICRLVNNQYGLNFHKLVINDCCLFDEFYEDVWKSIRGKKTLSSIKRIPISLIMIIWEVMILYMILL